ncbi:hypothetical protein X735_31475 [Mesorhizobium sp. L2C085B000]|uniref:GAP1-N1 domain-containing protein n=1 Tax=Mesorhizobium sp. L2C085B000 TaxID=1287117 RepID=UPI0003CFA0AB|nr:hypothetical protein [Mesorhizobium sp. L2C085B000]ESZ06342.1 hypothetical protein X735_31475 [Mesorhizobium sp. L2C085B000]
MIVVHTQIHGYLRGHQLLSSSVDLPKADQSVIDRLSDVAGPLRPSERFEPYLSGYPLPSGDRYVLARTWQDLTVTRAGCVRTLSLVIRASEWGRANSLAPFLELLDPSAFPEAEEAKACQVTPAQVVRPIAPVSDFRGGELLEALFLEETKPVAVFGAPAPELIATRLLTAVWADFRQRFAFSTFARSPRRIEGRQFDLLFAPKDARSKFADWPGRRIDGSADSLARHRWTGGIVERVLMAPVPRLLSDRDVKLAGPVDAKTAALLRISLLWDELVGKIHTTPTAALGLIDIADSRGVWNSDTLEALDGAIEIAVQSAATVISPDQAWEFVTALVRKMRGHGFQNGRSALRDAVARLSISSPQGAIAFLSQPAPEEVRSDFVPAIASGMAHASDEAMSSAMMSAPPLVLGRILAANDVVARRTAENPFLLDRVRAIIGDLEPHLLVEIRERLLPLLVEETQLSLAGPFIGTLDLDDLMHEVRHLDAVTGLAVPGFVDLIVDRARKLGGVGSLRELLLQLPRSDGRDRTLFVTLTSSSSDVSWLLGDGRVPDDLVPTWLVALLRTATPSDFASIVSDAGLRGRVLATLSADAIDVKRRMLSDGGLPLDVHLALLLELLPLLDSREVRERAGDALGQCLRTHFGQDDTQTIIRLLGAMGSGLDAGWAIRHGLERGVPAPVASRNLVAFNMAPAEPRKRIMGAVDDLARALEGRHVIDVDASAIDAAANLLADANHHAWSAALAASGRILPLLMRSTREPVSPLVAVAFPAVYREYGKADEIPDLLKFIPFVDWDRCKSARHELVSTFLASSAWAPGDLALTSCRCGDIRKILRRVAKSYGGDAYLSRVSGDLGHLDSNCRNAVEKAVSEIRSDRSSKYDWRD